MAKCLFSGYTGDVGISLKTKTGTKDFYISQVIAENEGLNEGDIISQTEFNRLASEYSPTLEEWEDETLLDFFPK